MASSVRMIGLDFGTTTCSAVVADAQLLQAAGGRTELSFQREIFRSEMVFTPLLPDDRLDLGRMEELLDAWLVAAQVQGTELFGGGALLTGLTAQRQNASALVALLRRRLGNALIAIADDPCLESWLAFMGSCAELSRRHPDRAILNLDIGGGTTNIALGQARRVRRTGCLFLGARHVRVIPGTYRVIKLSAYARALLDHLGITRGPGEDLTQTELDAILTFQVTLLESVCLGTTDATANLKELVQVPFTLPADTRNLVVTFSGGVGELIYRHLQGEPWPGTTHFGDLGVDLAQRIVQSPVWAESLRDFRPRSAGRATVYGLLRHATEISGRTLYLGAPGILPLADLPILGHLHGDASEAQMHEVLRLVLQTQRGGCVQVRLGGQGARLVRSLGQRLAHVLEQHARATSPPVVFLVEENLGKVLGQLVTRWGTLPVQVVVIDEVPLRNAQYVQIGLPHDQVVPVTFFGFLPDGDAP